MTSEPTVIVTGFARCGTTMMMRMLHNAGLPVIADSFASFEANTFSHPNATIDWSQFAGHAIKVLDPHRWTFPATANIRFLFMRRDPRQQAKSQAKLLADSGIQTTRQHRKAIEASLRRDYNGVYLRHPTLYVDFERVLRQPVHEAFLIAQFLDLPELNPVTMAAVVEARKPDCLPTLDYELQLIAAASGVTQ